MGLACLGTAWFGGQLLDRTPQFAPGLGQTALLVAALVTIALVLATLLTASRRLSDQTALRRVAALAAVLGIAATLMAPEAYAVKTMTAPYNGGDPHPGPGSASDFGGSAVGSPTSPVCPAPAARQSARPGRAAPAVASGRRIRL